MISVSRPQFAVAFVGEIQTSTHASSILHCTYIIEPLSEADALPCQTVLSSIMARFTSNAHIEIHKNSDAQIILEFTQHGAASRECLYARDNETIIIDGVPYRFRPDPVSLHLKRISTNQCLMISIKNLPLFLWRQLAVEQILGPYCAINYITQDTLLMENPSEFVCYAWAHRDTLVPFTMQINVPREPSVTTTEYGQPAVIFDRYTIHLAILESQYRPSFAQPRMLPYMPSTLPSTDEDWPRQCFISRELISDALVNEMFATIIFTSSPGTHFSSFQTLEEFLEYIDFI